MAYVPVQIQETVKKRKKQDKIKITYIISQSMKHQCYSYYVTVGPFSL